MLEQGELGSQRSFLSDISSVNFDNSVSNSEDVNDESAANLLVERDPVLPEEYK